MDQKVKQILLSSAIALFLYLVYLTFFAKKSSVKLVIILFALVILSYLFIKKLRND